MARSKVYFAPIADGEDLESIASKARRLADAADFAGLVAQGRPCALKTHFGEGENTGYVKPEVVARVAGLVAEAGGEPFATDTNTLYRGRRSQAVSHLRMAREHGFTLESLDAPVIIADGLHGADQVTVPISGGRHFKEVRIATALHLAASAIVLTHVKGHCQMGLGGSLKNVGMGCSARAGKLAQHQGGQPKFKTDKCTGCGACVRWCPTEAITLEGRKQKACLHPEKCIGCGECLALCPFDAIGFAWLTEGTELIEKVAEHALGFLSNKEGRVGYINVITDLTKNCDCVGDAQKTEYPNVGLMASKDLVAVDKAAADLTLRAFGKDIWSEWWPESNYPAQFSYGEHLGLGSTDYDLVEMA
jgi:hypothetical protein